MTARATPFSPESGPQTPDPDFINAVITGLAMEQKAIPPRFLYDTRGSELFEEIVELDEYYPSDCDIEILQTHGGAMAQRMGAGAVLVEFGSGSSRKTPVLLDAMESPAAYVPIDIAENYLIESAGRIEERFPEIPVYPLPGDFCAVDTLPGAVPANAGRSGFFPGSTIGNFEPDEAVGFFRNAGQLLGENAGFVVGADLQKDEDILHAAYNDREGVTAGFNLNLLERINNELGGDFDIGAFEHEARYNGTAHRIEMHLVSKKEQTARILDREFSFGESETIHTENSYKFTIEGFADMAGKAGWDIVETWTDSRELFSVHYLKAKGAQ